MSIGQVVPEGRLPVFSTDTREEAESLVILACPSDGRGNYYARELAEEQTLENLVAFSDHLARAHERLIEFGKCECEKEKP